MDLSAVGSWHWAWPIPLEFFWQQVQGAGLPSVPRGCDVQDVPRPLLAVIQCEFRPGGGDVVLPTVGGSTSGNVINTPKYKAGPPIKRTKLNDNNTCAETDLPATTQKQLLKQNKELCIKKEFGRDASRKYRDLLLNKIIMQMMRHTWWKSEVYNRADMRQRGAFPLSNYIFRQTRNSDGFVVRIQGFPIWLFPLNYVPQNEIGSTTLPKDTGRENFLPGNG